MWVLSLHLSSILGQFFVLSGYLLPQKRKKPHLFYSYGRFPGTHSVTVTQLNASTDFAYRVIFLTLSSTMGHFFRFRFPTKEQPAFIKNKEKKRRILHSSPLLSFGTHSKAVNKKNKNIKRDYSLWAILLIKSLTRGHFIFFLSAPKTGARNVSFSEYHICCHPLLPSRTDSETVKKLDAEGVVVCGSYP